MTKHIAVCDPNISEKIKSSLLICGYELVFTTPDPFLGKSVASHPDMLLFATNNTVYVEFVNTRALNAALKESDKNIISIKLPEKKLEYPDDILFNCLYTEKGVLCRKGVDYPFLHSGTDYRLIYTKQGYVKCNTAVVDDNSYITEDDSIYNTLIESGFDCLKIQKGYVKLSGYDYGFIGGASGKLFNGDLAFTGDITKHPDYKSIHNFCSSKGVRVVSLSDEPLYDYGSIITL